MYNIILFKLLLAGILSFSYSIVIYILINLTSESYFIMLTDLLLLLLNFIIILFCSLIFVK